MTDLLIDLRTATSRPDGPAGPAGPDGTGVDGMGPVGTGPVGPGPVGPGPVGMGLASVRRLRNRQERHERVTSAIGLVGAVILVGVTVLGALHSYDAVRRGAEAIFGVGLLADTFPLLADGVIAGATFRYVSLLRGGCYVRGWRMLAHAGIAATVYLNAAVATTVGQVPWHVVAPAGFSVLIELWSKEAVGEYPDLSGARREAIPLWMWVTDFRLARRARLQMVRTGSSFAAAVAEVHRIDVALQVLDLALPGDDKAERVTRRRLARWIRHGVLRTSSVLDVTGLNDPDLDPSSLPPAECLLRATFAEVLASSEPSPVAPSASAPPRVAAPVTAVAAPAPPRVAAPVTAVAAVAADEVLPRFLTDAEKTALRWAVRELSERGEPVTAAAVQARAADTVPAVAARARKTVSNYLRSPAAGA